MYRKVKRDNKIDRDRCYEEYKANKCNEININDGPWINDFCFEKKKCLESDVFFHEILIRYIKNAISVTFKDIKTITILITLATISIFFK